VLAAAATLTFYAFFYRAVVARWGPVVRGAMRRVGLDRRRTVREVDAVGKLAAAAVAQLAFALVLAAVAGVGADDFLGTGVSAAMLAAAIVLGVGELAFTSVVCTVIVELSLLRARDTGPTARAWSAARRAGWMSYFLLTVRAAPAPLAAATICLYVGGEEVIFRGILIPAFAGAGAVIAVGGAAILFAAVQSFGMPGRRASLYPTVGAGVIGLVHGSVFWLVPNIVPLVVAHLAFFATALAANRTRTPAGAVRLAGH
jgi:hypothetical protein